MQLAEQHHAAALQWRGLAAWQAALAAAADEQQQNLGLAQSFARSRALAAAWQGWLSWMDLQDRRRERLAALLSSLESAGQLPLSHYWQRWARAAQQAQARAQLAAGFAGRREAALLQSVLSVWAAYSRAMRGPEPEPESPFASPRQPGEDEALVWDVALLMAGGPGSATASSSTSSAASSTGSTGGAVSSGPAHTTIAVTAAPSTDAPAQSAQTTEAGQPRRWRFGLFRSRHLGHGA